MKIKSIRVIPCQITQFPDKSHVHNYVPSQIVSARFIDASIYRDTFHMMRIAMTRCTNWSASANRDHTATRTQLRLQSNADSWAFARKRRTLHCDAHVGSENKNTWTLKINAHDSVLSFRTSVYFYHHEVALQTNSRSLIATIIT